MRKPVARHRLLAATLLLALVTPVVKAETIYYRIDLAPSGQVIAADLPVTKGTQVVFHGYPSGNLVSVRRSDVKKVVRISSAAAEATKPSEAPVRIGNLAMQGGSPAPVAAARTAAPGGPASANSPASAPSRWNGYDPWVAIPGETPPMELTSRTNAVQTSPGSPPTAPSATSGQNPPQ